MVNLFKPLILELDKLHNQHLIHRDIKPDNLRIAADESGEERLVLLDFGAARSFVSAQVTKTCTAMVSPGYAPAEQYSPKSRQGPYTDVYALCATIYAVITGSVPVAATDRMLGAADIQSFSEMGMPVPQHVEKAILHGLAVKSSDRPQSMKELYKELTGEITAAVTEKPTEPVPTVQRDWNTMKRTDDLPERPEPKKSNNRRLIPLLLALLLAGGFFVFQKNIQQSHKNAAATKTAVFLTDQQKIQESGTKTAADAENTADAQQQMTKAAQQILFAEQTQTQEAFDEERTATAWFAVEAAQLRQTQTQSAIALQKTQTTAAEQTAQAESTATAALESTQNAMFGQQTEIAGTQNAFHATETMSVINMTQDAMDLLRTEMAQTQEAFSTTQTQAARPTATYTPQPTATNTLRPSATTAPSLTPITSEPFLYTVQEGDNCWSIISEFGVPLDLFLAINNLPFSCPIEIGQELVIPAPDQKMSTATPIPLDQFAIGQQIEYTVEINDTYPGIASKFKTTLDSIQRLNNIEDITSFPLFGQTLIIAVNLVTPTPSPLPTYTEVPVDVRVGDIITFGKYEQDNNLANGPEPIEWRDLDAENGQALMISMYALDTKRYNEINESTTWETSTLRKWLNGEFYNSAFNSSEQRVILQVTNENPDNSRYGTKGGNQTQDWIFLLSIDEVNKYFSSNEARKCQVTEYAKENRALVTDETSVWWLRSPGYGDLYASSVNIPGRVNLSGDSVDDYRIVVRPAFWLDLTNGEVRAAGMRRLCWCKIEGTDLRRR